VAAAFGANSFCSSLNFKTKFSHPHRHSGGGDCGFSATLTEGRCAG